MEDLMLSPEMQRLLNNKKSGYNYRKRRQADWLENYTLYRDKVTTNRLTQRQSVNLPLMKQTLKTLLKDVDDMSLLYFENLDNDKQKELFFNEYWNWTAEFNKMDLNDLIDKKQVFLYGRSFDQWQIKDGKVIQTIQDPQDILVSRYTDPKDINSSRFLIHTHIFKSLSEIENNENYDKEAIEELKMWHKGEQGLIRSSTNAEMLVAKNKKLAEMGLEDVDSPILGETIVELTMHFIYHEEDDDDEEQLYLYVEADDKVILMKERLEDVIGTTKDHFWRNHYPYSTWADDLERQDFWSDSVADMVRTPNKVMNSWFSQLVENRTLRNFGMHYYDSTVEGFMPASFNPIPWGWYGVPGNPREILQKVDIPDLSESLDEMQFVVNMIEKSSGATATQQGVQTERQITLGEVQLMLGEAKERIKGMSKFYTQAWKDRATIFLKLIEAASDKLDAVKIYKKGRNTTDVYTKEIKPDDWRTKQGFSVKVWSQDEKRTKDSEALQTLNAVKAVMPDNPKLGEIYQRKLLEFAGLRPEEINDILQFEREKMRMPQNPLLGQPGQQPGMGTQPPVNMPQMQL